MTQTDGSSERIWSRPWRSIFEQVFDVAVVGTGYAGYAAARKLEAAGERVLLLDRGSDVLWESGRAMACKTGPCDDPHWRELTEPLAQRDALGDGELDAPAAEKIASLKLLESDAQVLYYAAPVSAELEGDRLTGLIVATKSGLRRVAARQWIDATEAGELVALIEQRTGQSTPRRRASVQRAYLAIQHHDWPANVPREIEPPASLRGGTLTLEDSMWACQRMLRIELPADHAGWSDWANTICTALDAVHAASPDALGATVVSHMSLMPLGVYDAAAAGGNGRAGAAPAAPAANVAVATPVLRTEPATNLTERFMLGVAAAAELGQLACAEVIEDALARPIDAPEAAKRMSADVVVAGAGTGGALAAIAAARRGSKVICIEPMAFPGGIGAGGGIHNYYFGIPGGLQAELDRRVKDLMDRGFGKMSQVRGFHPEAKKIALLQMMRESGVTYLAHTMLVNATTDNGRVTTALASAPEGPLALDAKAWVDATGDGDLCAHAGATFNKGRAGDGLMHAYSQSAGQVKPREHQGKTLAVMSSYNFDAGWVDPTDAEDLTRARLVGICQYLRDTYDQWERLTYIAPAIGLRQGRQVKAKYMLTLADLIERRHFDDVIGFTGSHYDNHAVDYEFESDEAVFWVWLCRQWRASLACELPYRMLLPEGLDNVWIGSRALGVTQDAHNCVRMQRDIQRVGEAAGIAAALAVEHGVTADDVPISTLQHLLTETGAIKLERVTKDGPWDERTVDLDMLRKPDVDAEAIARGLDHLKRGIPDGSLWHLYRNPDEVRGEVRELLDADDVRVSWLAAGILAIWGDSDAEPRLLEAIRTREYGYDDYLDEHMTARKATEGPRPEAHAFLVPNWLAAVSLVRGCGSQQALPVLLDLAQEPDLLHNARTGIAVTVERLLRDGRVSDAGAVTQLVDLLLRDDAPGSFIAPRRKMGEILTRQRDGGEPIDAEPADAPSRRPEAVTTPRYSVLWQLHLTVARLCRLADAELPTMIDAYRHDHRLCVRRAFAAALEQPEAAPAPAGAE